MPCSTASLPQKKKSLELYAFRRKVALYSALIFLDFMHSVLFIYNSEAAALFATCSWMICFARNKVKIEGSCPIEELIANQTLHYFKEYLRLHHIASSSGEPNFFFQPDSTSIL